MSLDQIGEEEYFQDHNLIALYYYIMGNTRCEWLSSIRLYDVLTDWFDNNLDVEVYNIWKKRLDAVYEY